MLTKQNKIIIVNKYYPKKDGLGQKLREKKKKDVQNYDWNWE